MDRMPAKIRILLHDVFHLIAYFPIFAFFICSVKTLITKNSSYDNPGKAGFIKRADATA